MARNKDESMWYEYPDSKYGEGIIIDEYNGEFSLIVGNRGDNETLYEQWVYPQKRDGKGPIDKSLPWKTKLGKGKEVARETLKALIEMLGPDDVDSDDIPF